MSKKIPIQLYLFQWQYSGADEVTDGNPLSENRSTGSPFRYSVLSPHQHHHSKPVATPPGSECPQLP